MQDAGQCQHIGQLAQDSYGGNVKAAEAVGKAIAEKAIAAGVKQVCFDRREFKYHGRVSRWPMRPARPASSFSPQDKQTITIIFAS